MESEQMFSNRDLKNLIVPLFIEQLLVAMVGIADVFIVGFAGEAAVSGVSLVNSFNNIFIYLFTALAAGGAVVISQYIGSGRKDNANEAASQLLTSSVIFSLIIGAFVLIFNEKLMHLMFGKTDADVMNACVTYLRISAYSYPAVAVYNAGAAMYRSMGKTSTTMYISLLSNIINIIGNCIGVFILKAGIAGVAYPSLIARAFSAAAITAVCLSKRHALHYEKKLIFKLNAAMQKRIMRIAVPNGIENGVFQLVKVALSSIAAMFGTYQIAANGVAQSIWSLAALVCISMGPVFITVIGQCMGAGDTCAAEFYFKKLMKITIVFDVLWNGLIFAATPAVMSFYALAPETKRLVVELVLIHNIFNASAFAFADPLGKGLRAAGDVKFTMAVSLFTTLGVRLVFSVMFGIVFGMGVIGIAYAMCVDWVCRGVIFLIHFKRGRWKYFKVI